MKKMPCIFVRMFREPRVRGLPDFDITSEVTPGCEWVLAGEGEATRKWDGTACLVSDGKLFKRYDAKKGKAPPVGFVPAQPSPDPVTLHWPGWVPCVAGDPASQWHNEAWNATVEIEDGTYELCGPHFQSNPEKFEEDVFVRHGAHTLSVPRDFEGLREWLRGASLEGIVFHRGNGEMAKLRRDDFGFSWPVKEPL